MRHTFLSHFSSMLNFFPKLPVTEDDRLWVDEGFLRLEKLLGRRRLLDARVMLPIAEDFPDHYDKTAAAAERLFCRVCECMHVDRSLIEFEIFPDERDELRALLPSWNESGGSDAAGLYMHGIGEVHGRRNGEQRCVVAIRSRQLNDPLSLVATMAHELGHVILLGGGLMSSDISDHEPITDLLTVFLGFGIFTANSAARFAQFQTDLQQGWSMQRLGYLPEQVFGYALARFAMERAENKPEWEKYLSTNVRACFKRSLGWLRKQSSGPEAAFRQG
jgi:hypothetical protein